MSAPTTPPALAATTTAAPRGGEALLEARGVRVVLGGRAVVDGVDLDVRAGEVVGLVGPNGAGKSTLLRAVTGTARLAGGSVRIAGRPLGDGSRRDLAREVAVVQQLPEAPPAMLVRDLVLLGRHPHLRLLQRESPRDHAVAEEAMERAGCLALAGREIGTLSGGERRRAFIARALAQQPRLLLLDEPTANLDAQAQAEVFEVVRALAREQVGVLVVVHDLTLAAAYCDRVALLAAGRVVAAGRPSEVITAEAVRTVYGPRVTVISHPGTGAPLVVPARLEHVP